MYPAAMLAALNAVCKRAAVDQLYEIAIAHALVRSLGEDQIGAILDEAFAGAEFEPLMAEVA